MSRKSLLKNNQLICLFLVIKTVKTGNHKVWRPFQCYAIERNVFTCRKDSDLSV